MSSFQENNTYTGFAGVYDSFMEDIPYEAWACFVRNLLEINGVDAQSPEPIAELGCGTGTMTRRFLDFGYSVLASDLSEEMLAVAEEKCKKEIRRGRVTFFQADMRLFTLDEPVQAILSLCDSVNYLIEPGDLEKLFEAVKKALKPGGIFIFDLKTPWLYKNAMADNVFAETREKAAYIWENYFDEKTQLNEYALTLFLAQENGSYARCEEIHLQRAYTPEEIASAAGKTGLMVEHIYGEEPFEELLEEDERMFVVLKKTGKE